ncbi:uncharacterized protein LOC141850313 isoform X2 [Brevipalpus obovatus]
MPEPFDFGLMGPDIMDGVASACRSGKVFSREIRDRLMDNCVYPLIKGSRIRFPNDFIPSLKMVVSQCWDKVGDFCRRGERSKANACGVSILSKKGMRYYNFYQDNREKIVAAFGTRKDCILRELQDPSKRNQVKRGSGSI